MISKKELLKRIENLESSLIDSVECETCGYLLNKENAIVGLSEVRRRRERVSYGDIFTIELKEYIYHPHYCKIHDPDKKTKEKKV